MSGKEPGDISRAREESGKRADTARAAATATIGSELIVSFNRGKKDPSDMATHGHETTTGFEFCIERSGVVYTVSVARYLDS